MSLTETNFHPLNLEVWNRISDDPQLAKLDFRIETDRYGQLIISPFAVPSHGRSQASVCCLVTNFMKSGEAISECPISTPEGVKVADVAWCSDSVWQSVKKLNCFMTCPELCIEVIAPSDTRSEISEKKRLYFECGAKEVWICDLESNMIFYQSGDSILEKSELFPGFPGKL